MLYDSIEDLNSAISTPVELAAANRNDDGHFAGSEEAFRHWDEDGEVPGRCSKCHSAEGLPLFATEGVTIAQPPANGFQCTTCHTDLETWERYEFTTVEFPSGAELTFSTETDADGNLIADDSNMCMHCHQGRSSTASVDQSTAGLAKDSVSEDLGFINIHYFAASASVFGNEAEGGYQYPGKSYVGRNEHVPNYSTCVQCHSTHQLEVKVTECAACHAGVETVEDLQNIRTSTVDYDGDGDTEEGVYAEIDTLRAALYEAIQAYAATTAGTPIVYDPAAYPYFFIDTNANGEPDPGEGIYPNKYASWTPALLKAAYNYQYALKDPGGYAHNAEYVLQLLYDSIQDIGGSTAGFTRP